MRLLTIICGALMALATVVPAYAATIDTGALGADGQWISVEGQIAPDDFQAFKLKAGRLTADTVTVILSGPGGNLIAAMQIGEYIRSKRWGTLTSNDCYSACAAAWLAGTPRIMLSNTKIGFHAASVGGQEKGTGNALFGAYMSRLGLRYDAIAWATIAGPYDISYLTPAKAREIGIDFRVLHNGTKQTDVQPAQPPRAKLSPEQIRATFFTGAEFTATTPSGIKFKMIFTADGKALRVPTSNSGSRSKGIWKLDEAGYCTTWNGGNPNCFTVAAADKNKWSVRWGSAIIATWSK